jgi:hypothetical protein
MPSMFSYSKAAVERAMKIQEVLLRAMARKTTWWQAAEILGFTQSDAGRPLSTRIRGRRKRPAPDVGVCRDLAIANCCLGHDVPGQILRAQNPQTSWESHVALACLPLLLMRIEAPLSVSQASCSLRERVV